LESGDVYRLSIALIVKPSVQIYDPRRGESYEVMDHQSKRRFSSAEVGLYVLEAVGVDWLGRMDDISVGIRRTSRIGFVAVEPWRPWTPQLLRAVEASFGDLARGDASILAYFDVQSDGVKEACRIRSEHGGSRSGEWCLGGCSRPFLAPRPAKRWLAAPWNLSQFLSQAANLAFVLELAEMQQSTLMTKIFDGFDAWLDQLNL
jgi:hypothetical protein